MSTSITHQAREAISSRHSFFHNHAHAVLRKRKERLFQIARGQVRQGRQPVQRSLSADASAAQEHEAIADASGIGDLVDREEQGPAACGVSAQGGGNVAALPQVETVERLVGE
jgi:hypothetical protein